MGRAKGYASHAATSGDRSRFDAVLGARRGSMSAQATRDAQERQVRDHALTEMTAKLRLATGVGTVIELLATDHRGGGAKAGTPEYEKLCMDLSPTTSDWGAGTMSGFKELATVAAHGDPEHWPGLTAPAVDALGAHLQAMADGGEDGEAGRLFRGRTMALAILMHESSLKRYERLAPVLEGLAALMPHLPNNDLGLIAAQPIAEMLRVAPTEVLAGPLQPLVQAVRKRILDESLTSSERNLLERLIADRGLADQPAEAFRGDRTHS